jgi:uncharacterized surface protein with fasciclin (FAS1) repeats
MQCIKKLLTRKNSLSKFGDLLDRLAQVNNDRSLINTLSGQSTSGQGTTGSSSGFTVFIPTNEAFAANNVPRDPDQLNNDVRNFVVKGRLKRDSFKNFFDFIRF